MPRIEPFDPDELAGLSARPSSIPAERRTSGQELSATGEQRLQQAVVLAFAPIDKRALGVAVGLVAGMALALVTLLDMLVDPMEQAGLGLLSQYLYGYQVSPRGALIGLAWGFVVGFVAGWFAAFARNALTALWLIYIRARAEWLATRDFLDYV